MRQAIIVNATAARESGALTILRQFVSNISDSKHYIIFVDPSLNENSLRTSCKGKNLTFVRKDTSGFYKRVSWDLYGINKWIKKNNIDPIGCISLQNTGYRIDKRKIPFFIYYHQSIPFFKQKWNPFKKKERALWFYKYIYPFYISLFLKKSHVIFVQLDFIKKSFSKKFHHPLEKIQVYSPAINESKLLKTIDLPQDSINLFYPATSQFYKNHKILKKALEKTSIKVNLYLTAESNKKDNSSRIIELGKIPFDEVCAYYNSVDALVFPSYIETFGLPLIEAALTGLPIIASDLPYAREVLKGYKGVTFVKYNDVEGWIEAINRIRKGKRYPPISISERPSWKELFQSIESNL